jgi:hypothetical protein
MTLISRILIYSNPKNPCNKGLNTDLTDDADFTDFNLF